MTSSNRGHHGNCQTATVFGVGAADSRLTRPVHPIAGAVATPGAQAGSDSGVEEGRSRDRFDVMVRHLWHVGERSGWFRDADFDGLVSIR